MMTRKLRWNERLACRFMSQIQWRGEDDIFYKCQYKTVWTIARLLLGGRDPLAFLVDLILSKEFVDDTGLEQLR